MLKFVNILRLWSINPQYLDSKGLGGVWREGLLAQVVILGRTNGWKNHPQLIRFQNHKNPISAIGFYLLKLWEEAHKRGYNYDRSKIIKIAKKVKPIEVTKGQLLFEFSILKERLKRRSQVKFQEIQNLEKLETYPNPHPLFVVMEGGVAPWEKSYWTKHNSNLLNFKNVL